MLKEPKFIRNEMRGAVSKVKWQVPAVPHVANEISPELYEQTEKKQAAVAGDGRTDGRTEDIAGGESERGIGGRGKDDRDRPDRGRASGSGTMT